MIEVHTHRTDGNAVAPPATLELESSRAKLATKLAGDLLRSFRSLGNAVAEGEWP